MLYKALSLIRDELETYIRNQGQGLPTANVVLENVALLETQNDSLLTDNIIITLVNLEEESTLKNMPNLKKNAIGGYDYVDPPIHLNLYLLFCANFVGGQHPNNNYTEALKRLSYVIQFFQSRNTFTLSDTPNATLSQNTSNLADPEVTTMKLKLELYTLTFEQINHLWGSLGGRQIPFVMFKVRLVKIRERITQDASLIEEIQDRSAAIQDR
ncbi:MAG: DUF4255 domain-containing protein [Lewinellaceae bacterium]|nr:DUF4255 domain-containing protein [Phaeodactylibacter sp.]MCB9265795.1 DUF4255 domain-containing protein [Lewinellaceae bacterium]MCB9352561.1 DUF4255 domain-containing protein [Lewinellaceae bacterium]